MAIQGIDVSHHQKVIDWAAVAGGGKKFCYIKATQGKNFKDNMFTTNWNDSGTAGLIHGAYHFYDPAFTVDDNIQNFVSVVQSVKSGDLLPALDVEAPETWSAISVSDRISFIKRWLDIVGLTLNVKPILYMGNDFYNSLNGDTSLGTYNLWLADYRLTPVVPAAWTKYSIWQYTDGGNCPGVSTNVDLDQVEGTMTELNWLRVP